MNEMKPEDYGIGDRTIKFRAWNAETEEMLSWADILDTLCGRISDPFNFNGFTVMQFTGLKDKNGKEIYEGDVLQFSDKWEWYRHSNPFCSKEEHKEILENHDKFPYERRVVKIPEGYDYLLSPEIQSYWEVIGNIFQNPELIENLTTK